MREVGMNSRSLRRCGPELQLGEYNARGDCCAVGNTFGMRLLSLPRPNCRLLIACPAEQKDQVELYELYCCTFVLLCI